MFFNRPPRNREEQHEPEIEGIPEEQPPAADQNPEPDTQTTAERERLSPTTMRRIREAKGRVEPNKRS